MRGQLIKRVVSFRSALAAIAIIVVSGCQPAAEPTVGTFEESQVQRITVQTDANAIRLLPSSGRRITVRWDAKQALPAVLKDGHLQVTVKPPEGMIHFAQPELVIEVPSGAVETIGLLSVSGSISVGDVRVKELVITTDSGGVAVAGSADHVHASTRSGEIKSSYAATASPDGGQLVEHGSEKQGGGAANVTIKSTSGNIELRTN
ncbi:DUF4097 family beta strand repeat-containing protein [Paenibacillus chartarius]|uniref:DUF4097 family beta strand repeat-containing protein n=1 Tax=Paenibacillus chartarius TaxID=747481 RepID=A0ABV6DLG1_9BACL